MESVDLASLEAFLQARGARTRPLGTAAFVAARRRWRELFGPITGAKRWSWADQGYDWHVFSLERHEAIEGEVATLAFRNGTANVHQFMVLSAREGFEAGFEVASALAIDLGELRQDWSMVAGD